MSCYFAYKGNDLIIGFNFDIPENIETKVRVREDFVYGLIKVENKYIVPFGVNKDGSFGGFTKVAPPTKQNPSSYNDVLITELVEDYIYGKYSLDQVKDVLVSRQLANPVGLSYHAMLFDPHGRNLILEPGRGVKELEEKINVLTCFSYFEPFATKNLDNSGYDTYNTIVNVLKNVEEFTVVDALSLLKELRNDGPYPTRISMVYSSRSRCVYWALDSDFDNIHKNQF